MARAVTPRKSSSRGEARPASANYHAHALARGLGLMERLAESPRPLTLGDFSDSTELPKSTLVRLLSVLVELEYIVRVDEQPSFRLGHKVQHLARAYEASLDIAAVAGLWLQEVASATGHTCNLGMLDGHQVLHVCVEQPDRALRFNSAAGSRDHLFCTGLGKLLLSTLPDEEVAARLPQDGWTAITPSTLSSPAALKKDLKKIRERGYAVDDNERSVGLRCVAVGIEIDGHVPAAVSLSGPAAEFTPARQKEYAAELKRLADRLAGHPDFVVAIGSLSRSLRP